MAEDYFSFEDVMGELELGEEELKRMVSEGELRAFRDDNKMKFKQEDVESLKKGRITEPTIILPSTPSTETSDETVLDLDIGQETASLSDETAPDLAIADTTDDDLIVQPSEDEVGAESEETFIEEDSDTGLTTEPLQLADEAEETVEAVAVEEEVVEDAPAPVARPRRMAPRSGRIPVAVEEEIERKRAHWIWTLFIFFALCASLYGGFFFYDQIRMEQGLSDRPSPITAGLMKWTLDKFWEDAEYTKFHMDEYPNSSPPDPGYRDGLSYEQPTFLLDEKGMDPYAPAGEIDYSGDPDAGTPPADPGN